MAYLVGQLVGYHHGNPEFIGGWRGEGVIEEAGLSVRSQTPVLHCTRLEVWDGYEIWRRTTGPTPSYCTFRFAHTFAITLQ